MLNLKVSQQESQKLYVFNAFFSEQFSEKSSYKIDIEMTIIIGF